MTVHTRRRECRICDHELPSPFLSLGPSPLANSFLRRLEEATAELSFPLDVALCGECGLVQLLDVIDPEVLFRDYIYVSGTSTTMSAHLESYARDVLTRLPLGPDDLVVEVASNDGTLLRHFHEAGIRTLGVEPARNIAAIARERGIETVEDFFDSGVGQRLRDTHGPARAVLANNVLAHVDDPRDFLRGAAALVAPDGMVVIEVPSLAELVAHLEYDTIYHEHLSYFSITALCRLCEAAGLRVVCVERVPVHGGSLRIYATLPHGETGHAVEVCRQAEEEVAAGLTSEDRFAALARDVQAHREALRTLLQDLASRGATLAAYGAPAKGNTLLNYCQLDSDLLPFTVDRSPLKVGTWTPGMHLPVRDVADLDLVQPEYILILAWNVAEEIMAQLPQHRHRGGRFILPIPHPRVV